MPLPTKSRYTIPEAAKYVANIVGERVTTSQILDWGTQGLYGLHLLTHDCHVNYEGQSESVEISGALVKFQPTPTQTATLESGYSIEIASASHDGRKVTFMESPAQRYHNRYGPHEKAANFNSTSVVLLGSELSPFVESIGKAPESGENAAWKTERDKLLKHIGCLALALAEKGNIYKKGTAPNASQIAKLVGEILDALPDANKSGAGDASIRASIASGLELLRK